jgi:hypothetical protein
VPNKGTAEVRLALETRLLRRLLYELPLLQFGGSAPQAQLSKPDMDRLAPPLQEEPAQMPLADVEFFMPSSDV